MTPTMRPALGLALAAALAVAASQAHAQQAPDTQGAQDNGISDLGTFGALPLDTLGRLQLRTEHKEALRKLQDKHIRELRGLEDQQEQQQRALRAKQYAEREVLLKSFAAGR